MGRRPSVYLNLPARMRCRKQRSGRLFYYYEHGGKPRRETALGSDYALAVKRWAELEIANGADRLREIATFRYAAEYYLRSDWFMGKSPRTQRDNLKELAKLYEFFDRPPAPLDGIEPQHIRQYLTWRTKGGTVAKVRANREKALFSHVFNFARDRGYTAAPNPCAGMKGFREKGRAVYVEGDVYAAIWGAAGATLRDAMDLAYLTGQRPGDVRRMSETGIRDGVLEFRQGKTDRPLRIEVTGELAALVKRIKARKAALPHRALALVVDDSGRPISERELQWLWELARRAAAEKCPALAGAIRAAQFRDLRAKAGTDKADSAGDIRQAQRQLGHSSVVMTEHYVRNRKGEKVGPTR